MKAIRADFPTDWPHANVYTLSDLHLGDPCTCSVRPVTKLFVNAAATMAYGGYGQAQGYKPACTDTPVIHLEAEHKRMSATM